MLFFYCGAVWADPGPWFGDLRYRYEFVDEAAFAEQAHASTLRTRLGLKTDRYRGFEALVEGSNVLALGFDDYNAGAGSTPDRSEYPIVADAEDTRLSRAWLAWSNDAGTRIQLGRQRIKLDNDRFIGNVGWRQNEQTYDGLSLRHERGDWSLFYAWVAGVNRIFDSEVDAGRHDHQSQLLNIGRQLAADHRLVGYVYDIDDRDQPGLSNRTVGVRYLGAARLAGLTLGWQAEVAHQTETGRAPVDYNADYLHLQLTEGARESFRPRLGYERLGGNRDPGLAFRTPLATLHAFNGWADRFLVTPDRGLEDVYLGVLGQRGRLTWQVMAHQFHNEQGGSRLGREIDASLSWRLAERSQVLIKGARFESSSHGLRDATKLWAQLSYAWP
ncbi:alginate export family protein [Wenzhouxiangella marina]|uniref:alginate export family protein n=1 Tax=Wenzhouxiangella marina TaxID=1579979 RepID=UPI0006738B5C|nr:alginate export family protein [Wenzhouxiangella marina]MBB6088019.1 hypothetical protein [Wenzhouxiangella marina]